MMVGRNTANHPRNPADTRILGEISALSASLQELSLAILGRGNDASEVLGNDYLELRKQRLTITSQGNLVLVEAKIREMAEVLRERLGVLKSEENNLFQLRQKARRLAPEKEAEILQLLAVSRRQCRAVQGELTAKKAELASRSWVPEVIDRR